MTSTSHADRLLFSRGENLYLSELGGQTPRKICAIGTETQWAASPDGRRVAWLKKLVGPQEGGLEKRPIALFLGDTAGRRQKKLATTNALKDRNAQRVTQVGPTREGGGATRLDDWSIASLSFSEDGRTIYIGLTRIGASESEVATVALDAFTGAAVVDADGYWKVLAPIAQGDARASLLVGAGAATAAAKAGVDTSYLALTLVNFTDESVQAIPTSASLNGQRPPYGSALWPTLSPDGKKVAFSALPPGLWLADVATKNVRRLIPTEATRPRFSLDGKALYFLAPRPSTGDRQSFDLFQLDPTMPAATPTRQFDDIDWFDVIPD
ncbi:MAG: hypothetical protein QM758_26440 [Armatimonas sp.]